MGDSTDDSYILIEDSRNLDEDTSEKQGDVHDKSKQTALVTETDEPIEDLTRRLLDQGGIEIIPNKEEEDSYL